MTLIHSLPLQDCLNCVRVDQAWKVSIRDLGSWQLEVGFLSWRFPQSAVDGVQLLERSFRPNAKSSKMRSRWQLQKIQSVNWNQLNTREIAECLLDSVVFIVDDQRSSSHNVSTISHLSFTTSDLFGLLTLLNVVVSIQTFQQSNSCFCFGETFNRVGDHNWNFRNSFNLVTSSHQQWRNGTGS